MDESSLFGLCLSPKDLRDLSLREFVLVSSYGFSSVVSPSNVYSCGAVILCHPVYSLRDFQTDDCGRLVLAEFQIRESLFRIACMLLIKNRKEINFVAMFPPPVIRLSPQCFVATSTL